MLTGALYAAATTKLYTPFNEHIDRDHTVATSKPRACRSISAQSPLEDSRSSGAPARVCSLKAKASDLFLGGSRSGAGVGVSEGLAWAGRLRGFVAAGARTKRSISPRSGVTSPNRPSASS